MTASAPDAVPGGRLNLLLLCHYQADSASTIIDHVRAFPRFSAHRFFILSNLGDLPYWLDLRRFDGVIIHYSLIASYDSYLSPEARRAIRAFRGFKAAFVQDDYRWINRTVEAFAYLGIHALFPLVGPEIMDEVYAPERLPGVRRETVLTGYVPEELVCLTVPPLEERPIDVGYRARKLPAWIGSHTLQKWQIAERFAADAPQYGLTVDLSWREEDRIYGEAWTSFLINCKAVLGTESGASVCDFTGRIQEAVESHVARDPDASFETLRELYFEQEDGRIMMNVISPRCLEAAALRTLMILYEGHYSGVLEPWRHYVPLQRDHGNMNEVVQILRSPAEAQLIVDRAFQEVALNQEYTFRGLVAKVDRVIAECWQPHMRSEAPPFSDEEYEWRTCGTGYDMTHWIINRAGAGPGSRSVFDALSGITIGPNPASTTGDDGSPGEIQVRLRSPLPLSSLHLVWATLIHSPKDGEVHGLKGEDEVYRARCGTPDPVMYQRIPLPGAQGLVDGLVLRVRRSHGAQDVELVDLRLECASAPMLERLRLLRRRIGLAILYRVGQYWMKLPPGLRTTLKGTVRSTYDTLFGRNVR